MWVGVSPAPTLLSRDECYTFRCTVDADRTFQPRWVYICHPRFATRYCSASIILAKCRAASKHYVNTMQPMPEAFHVSQHASPLPSLLPLYTQLNEAATESDLYAFAMRSHRMVQQTMYRTACSRSETSSCGGESNDAERDQEGENVNLRLIGTSTEVLDAMVVGLKERSRRFERLGEAVDR